MGVRRKLVKFSLVTFGVAAVLVALGFGLVQLAVHQLPNYEDELDAWVTSELKLELEYARLDAAWRWRGPELAFREANVRTVGDEAPFLRAREASVGFTTFGLLRSIIERSPPRVDRLTFDGTELTIARNEAGGYRMQGAPAGAGRESSSVDVPPDIDVLVRNSRVLYLDASRSIAWDFQDVAGSLRRDADLLTLEASARPPRELAERIAVTAQASIAAADEPGDRFTGDWRLHADVDTVDLGLVTRLLPPSAVVPQAGRGDVAVWLEWRDGVLASGTAELALADVVLQSPLGAGSRFERVALSGDWELTSDAWRFALRDVAVTRGGRAWPESANVDIDVARDADGVERFGFRSSFVRLEDLTPFFSPLPESRLLKSWFALEPRGDLRGVDLLLERNADARIDYAVTSEFAGLSIATFEGAPGFTGVTGQIRADSRTGRLELASTSATLDWRTLFRGVLDVPELRGTIVWRTGQDTVRVVSDDLLVVTPAASLRTNLELTLPMDDSSPRLDLRTSVSGFDIAAVPRYLPAHKMPAGVVSWLDDALRGGRALGAEVVFVGPVRAFPFDAGEGEFRATVRVADTQLGFVRDWPPAEDLDGTVEFVNASFAGSGSGRVLGNRTENVRVGIADLRTGELTLQTTTTGGVDQVLAFLNGSPLIARHLGEDFARLEAPAGSAEVTLDLLLPVRARQEYRLTAGLKLVGGELAYRGFPAHVNEIFGELTFADGVLRGSGVQGIFLDGPIVATVGAAAEPGYRARIDVEGDVTIDAVVDAFNLPYGELLAGQTGWRGSLLLPTGGAERRPAKISVSSNLSGVALRLPEPFAKPPGEPTNLELDIAFPGGGLAMEGYLGATRRFVLDFDATPGDVRPFRFRRGALRFGGELAEFRAERGVTIDGSLPLLRVGDWLALPRSGGALAGRSTAGRANWSGMLGGADLDVAEFSIFGQRLGSTRLTARRRSDDWQFEIDSNAIAGTVLVPVDLEADPKVVAVMRRLYLSGGDGTGTSTSSLDPRKLPGLQLHADEFGVGQRLLGRLDAEILSDPLGLRLVSFESATDSFTAQGSGGWFMGADGDTTRFAVGINSTNVGQMLTQLGVTPFVEAETAEITASVFWPGPPSGSWLDHLSGDLALRAEKGSLIDVEPGGAGRFAGLLSITALPRRLALDFRDVFNRGLVFDDINADFVIVDGNAYTDNLKLTGPVAEVGIIGRTGLRDRDYHQQAVVTAEPGKILPTVGALLGGPQVAAALLLFTRIFKKPLLGIGRASYCVSGSWSEPKVERLTDEQLEEGAVCAELPPNGAVRPAVEGIAE